MPTRSDVRFVALTLVAAATLAGASAAHAQHEAHHPHPALVEGGQGGFAALAEVVSRLEADPRVDWSRVDITALREHLVDMNALFLSTAAREKPVAGGVEIEIEATGRALEAVHRMVPAHASELDRRPGWSATARTTRSGAKLKVIGANSSDESKIRALGFYGLMALDQHHRAHHWAIARGNAPHTR